MTSWLDSWWLDVKLGVRMLIKYPGLTLVGGFGIAVAVAIAAGAYSFIHGNFLAPSLPLEEGDRIISIEIWDSAANRPDRRILHEYRVWREELQSVQPIGAFRTITPNLITPGEQPVSVRVASMSASGFRVAGVQPLLGRRLTEADEREGAPPVVVIGENVWRNRFASDPAILGRTLQLGATQHSVVGVMPKDFAFPVNHRFWTPLRSSSAPPEPFTGPDLMVFGRLAPGATLESAQAELETIAGRAPPASPELSEQLRPRAAPYAHPFMGLQQTGDITALHMMQGVLFSLLVLVCLNVAILVYSRTATRQGEIAVRSALGASRGRIVTQLFVEALALAAVAALTGVAIAELALRYAAGATLSMASELPFWVSFHLSPGAVLYAAALAVLAAAVVGVLPALQATRGRVQDGLRNLGAGGSGMRLGTTWTVLIVAQVGFAVALLPAAVGNAWATLRSGFADPGFQAEEFLSARLGMDAAPGADPADAGARELARRFAGRQEELMRRLEAEPRVSDVTFAMVHPGEEPDARIEIERVAGSPQSETEIRQTRFNRVDVDFFRAFDVPVLTGRGFRPADVDFAGSGAEEARQGGPVVVNLSFAEQVFAGDALGRRIRYVVDEARRGAEPRNPEAEPWYEIVGVVRDFPAGASPGIDDLALKLYHPAAAGRVRPAALAFRIRDGAPSTFAGRLREIAAAVDPELHLRDIRSMDEVLRREQWIRRLEAAALAAVTLSVLMLSSAGIYSLMSMTVSQRRKEIGIRMALGADRKRIIAGIFSRSLGQLAVGAALGAALAAALQQASEGDLMRGHEAVALPVVALLMLAAGLLAALGPARRSLRIEPTEALREQ